MTVRIVSDFQDPQATLAKYHEAITLLGGTPGNPGGPHPAPGCLFHFVTVPGSSGFRITDIFTTPELFAAYAEKLGRACKQVGLPELPQTNSIDVVRYMSAH